MPRTGAQLRMFVLTAGVAVWKKLHGGSVAGNGDGGNGGCPGGTPWPTAAWWPKRTGVVGVS